MDAGFEPRIAVGFELVCIFTPVIRFYLETRINISGNDTGASVQDPYV
jgi:hypothetical protein